MQLLEVDMSSDNEDHLNNAIRVVYGQQIPSLVTQSGEEGEAEEEGGEEEESLPRRSNSPKRPMSVISISSDDDDHAEVLPNLPGWGIMISSPRSMAECAESDISRKTLRSPLPSNALREIIGNHEENEYIDEELECELMSAQTPSETNAESASNQSGQFVNRNEANLKIQNLAQGLAKLLNSHKHKRPVKKLYLQQNRDKRSDLRRECQKQKSRTSNQQISFQQAISEYKRKLRSSRNLSRSASPQKPISSTLYLKPKTPAQQEITKKRKVGRPRKLPPQVPSEKQSCVSTPTSSSKEPNSLLGKESDIQQYTTDKEADVEQGSDNAKKTKRKRARKKSNKYSKDCNECSEHISNEDNNNKNEETEANSCQNKNIESITLQTLANKPVAAIDTPITASVIDKYIENVSGETQENSETDYSEISSPSMPETSPTKLKFIYNKTNRRVVSVSIVTPEDESPSNKSDVGTLNSTSTKHVPTVNIEPLDTWKDPNENDRVMIQSEVSKHPHPEESQNCSIKQPNSQEFRELTTTNTSLKHNQQNLTQVNNNTTNVSNLNECFTEFLENYFTVFDGSMECQCSKMADLLFVVMTESRNCNSRVTTAELLCDQFKEEEISSALKYYDETFNKHKLDFENMFYVLFEKISRLIVHGNCKVLFLLAWFTKVFLRITSLSPDLMDSLHEIKENVISLLTRKPVDSVELTRAFHCDETTFELNCWQVLDLMLDCNALHEKQGGDENIPSTGPRVTEPNRASAESQKHRTEPFTDCEKPDQGEDMNRSENQGFQDKNVCVDDTLALKIKALSNKGVIISIAGNKSKATSKSNNYISTNNETNGELNTITQQPADSCQTSKIPKTLDLSKTKSADTKSKILKTILKGKNYSKVRMRSECDQEAMKNKLLEKVLDEAIPNFPPVLEQGKHVKLLDPKINQFSSSYKSYPLNPLNKIQCEMSPVDPKDQIKVQGYSRARNRRNKYCWPNKTSTSSYAHPPWWINRAKQSVCSSGPNNKKVAQQARSRTRIEKGGNTALPHTYCPSNLSATGNVIHYNSNCKKQNSDIGPEPCPQNYVRLRPMCTQVSGEPVLIPSHQSPQSHQPPQVNRDFDNIMRGLRRQHNYHQPPRNHTETTSCQNSVSEQTHQSMVNALSAIEDAISAHSSGTRVRVRSPAGLTINNYNVTLHLPHDTRVREHQKAECIPPLCSNFSFEYSPATTFHHTSQPWRPDHVNY